MHVLGVGMKPGRRLCPVRHTLGKKNPKNATRGSSATDIPKFRCEVLETEKNHQFQNLGGGKFPQTGEKGKFDMDLLGGSSLVLDAAVHEARKVGRGLLDGSSLLGDGELLHELVEHLDGLLVLSHGDGWCVGIIRNRGYRRFVLCSIVYPRASRL